MSVLKAVDISKTYDEGGHVVRVLKGINLKLYRGEILALEGPSGSGKTTLLSILGCILTPSGGELYIKGHAVDTSQPNLLPAVRRKFIGFVFQQFNLFPALTARENVEYALNIKRHPSRSARTEALAMLDAVGLSEQRDFLPRQLSGGQKQRVAIARALAGKPPVLLADEPTANLDAATGEQILALFRKLVKIENRALLIVTHDPKVRTIADRVVSMRDGQIIETEA